MDAREPKTVDADGDVLLCLSHLRWDFVHQRPQHLLSRAAADRQVIFFEEPEFEPIDTPRLDVRNHTDGVTIAVPRLPHGLPPGQVARAQRRLLDALLADARPKRLIAWYYTPFALTFTRQLRPALTVYDNMDELSAFRGASPRLLRLERDLFRRADLVFTGGQSLFEAKRDRHPNMHAFPSSIDFSHFARARRPGVAERSEQARLARPRLGFFGVIDERMDVDLVGAIAERRPDWQIVMIGPVVKIDPATLPRRANLHWIGPKHYRDLPDYLAGWDLGLMPFALNESTRFINPTKTLEFLAAGLPVVSTPITDVVRPYGDRGLVEIATTAEDFVEKAEFLLQRPREPWLAEVDDYLVDTSWDKTWDQMLALMETALGKRPHAIHAATSDQREATHV